MRELRGSWLVQDGKAVADAVCEEIDYLIARHLEKVCDDDTGWLTLFRDRRDGTLWERSYPNSGLHGGGPPRLAVIDIAVAKSRYRCSE
jgi:hypothetical protein